MEKEGINLTIGEKQTEKVLFRTLRTNVYGVVMLLAAVLMAVPAPASAGITIEEKPVSLISSNLVMEQGLPCVALALIPPRTCGCYPAAAPGTR